MKLQVGLSLVIVFVVILALVGVVLVINYNGLVKSEKNTEEAKAQIEAVLQRRLDLIPNLVQTVKGYAAHEKSTLTAVIEARSNAQDILKSISSKKSLNKEDMAVLTSSQNVLKGTLKSLFALAENYPDLKAGAHFLALQDQLEGTENRISVARQRYNYAVKVFNTEITVFPGNIIAAIFGFEEKEYFQAKDEASEPPEVKF